LNAHQPDAITAYIFKETAIMAEIINLRLARKARNRAQADQAAAENRAKFGRTKSERERDRRDAERLAQQIDGAKRDETD
jgi:hypothetical protein